MPSYGAPYQQAQNKYKMMQALMGQQFQPTQGATAGTAIGKMLTAYMANKGMGGAGQEMADIEQQKAQGRKTDLASAMGAYRQDQPYQEQDLFPGEQPTPGLMTEGAGKDRSAMIQSLMGAETPALQDVGLTQMLATPEEKAAEAFTLAPGQIRYGPAGDILAEGPEKKDTKAKDKTFDQSAKLRTAFEGQTKDFVKVRDAYGRIQAAAKNPTAAGDLALIFNYMKVLDPGSTVREGEFATAQNAAGVPTQIMNMYNRAKTGERLAPLQRTEFVDRAGMLYGSQLKGLEALESQYVSLSEQFGLDPKGVIVDYRIPEDGGGDGPAEAEIADITARAKAEGLNLGRWDPEKKAFEVYDEQGKLIGHYD